MQLVTLKAGMQWLPGRASASFACVYFLYEDRRSLRPALCGTHLKHKGYWMIARKQGKTCRHRGASTFSYLIYNPCLILIWGKLWEVPERHKGSDPITKGKLFRFGLCHSKDRLLCAFDWESPTGFRILSERILPLVTSHVVSDWYRCGRLKVAR